MWALTWVPKPRMNRLPDKPARSQAAWAVTIGLRGNATAIPGPASIRPAAASAAPQVRKGLCLVSVTHMPAKPASSTARAAAAASPSGRPSGKKQSISIVPPR
jgi:hypothetical protein